MSDLYPGDLYEGDVYGGGAGPGPGGDGGGGGGTPATVPVSSFFDGVKRPRIQVLAGFGSALDPGTDYLHLGVGPGLGTGMLGGGGAGTGEVDITSDVRSINLSMRGRASDIDAADPVTATIVLSNRHGNYDPSNPATPYWGTNRLTAQQEGLEDGTTTGWQVGGSCTISSSTTVARSGSRSLRLTSTASSGGIWANTSTGTDGQRVAPGDPIKVSAWFRSATRSVSGIVAVMFWDIHGVFVAQTNASGVATTTTGWTQGSTTTVAPSGAAYASVQVLYDSVIAVGELHYADDIIVQATGMDDNTPIRIRYTWGGVAYDRFFGELAGVALDLDFTPDATATLTCMDGLEKLGRAYLPQVVHAVQDGDKTGARIHYLANQAIWPTALRSIDTGYTTLGPTSLGEAAAELMRKVEATEFGLVFVSGGAILTFYDRHRGATATRSTTVQATFSDTGAGVIRIPALQMARSRDAAFNRVAITREPNPSAPPTVGDVEFEDAEDEPVEQVADDIPSQDDKGVLGFPAEVGQLHRNDWESLAMAQYLVVRYRATTNRISQIEVNMLRGNWDTLLPLGPLDRVAVLRDYGPNAISTELLIQGVGPEEITVEPPSWGLTFTTSPPPPTPSLWRLGTTQIGTGRLGW